MSDYIIVKNKLINLRHVTMIEKMEKGDNEKVKIRFVNGHIVHVDEEFLDVDDLAYKLSAVSTD